MKKIFWFILIFLLSTLIAACIFIFINEEKENKKELERIAQELIHREQDSIKELEKQNKIDLKTWNGPDILPDSLKHYMYTFKGDSMRYKYNHGALLKLEFPEYIFDNIFPKKEFILLNDISLYINRENDRILEFYDFFNDKIKDIVSLEYYQQSGLYSLVKQLIISYEKLMEQKDYVIIINSAHDYLIQNEVKKEKLFEIFDLNNFNNYNLTDVNADKFWLYSFWIRRYKENNIDAIIKILKDIDTYYEQI